MQIGVGTIEDDAYEVGELVRDYYTRTIASHGMRPLAFKWNTYKELEKRGECTLFTMRDNEDLVGFALYIIQDHLHHEKQRVAHCTMIGVKPEYRGRGIGRALIVFAEEAWFKKRGITHMVHHHRTIYNVTPLFESMGFKLEELGYVKEL
jgi:ribosomal protein S18 acetylase RimI-like enzyme